MENKKTDLSEADFADLYKPRDLGPAPKRKKRKKAEIDLEKELDRWLSDGGKKEE